MQLLMITQIATKTAMQASTVAAMVNIFISFPCP
jgi:hypothetical protein